MAQWDDLDEAPRWDVALEALAREEVKRLGRPIGMEDVARLGREYSFRTHDFLETLYQLTRHGAWYHAGTDDDGRPVSEDVLDRLYVHGRVDEDVANRYSVTWAPAEDGEG